MRKLIVMFFVFCLVSSLSIAATPTSSSSDLPALETQHFELLHAGKNTEALDLMTKSIQPLREAAKTEKKQERFIDNGDGTITDNALNLMWTKNANHGLHSRKEGKAYCKKLKFAGHDDWTMPVSDELESLLGATSTGKLVKDLFENIQGPTYWSDSDDDMCWGKTRGLSFWTMDVRKGDGDNKCWILPVRNTKKVAKKGLFSR